MVENIIKIFNSEDEKEVKQAFKNIIIEQFRSDVENSDVYLFEPSDVREMVEDAFKEVIKEIKIEFKEKYKEKIFKSLEEKLKM